MGRCWTTSTPATAAVNFLKSGSVDKSEKPEKKGIVSVGEPDVLIVALVEEDKDESGSSVGVERGLQLGDKLLVLQLERTSLASTAASLKAKEEEQDKVLAGRAEEESNFRAFGPLFLAAVKTHSIPL